MLFVLDFGGNFKIIFKIPKTIVFTTDYTLDKIKNKLLSLAEANFETEFIVKHNRSGKGIGIKLCHNKVDLG